MKAYIWDRLRSEVFPEFKSRQKVYRERRQQKVQKETEQQFRTALDELPAPVLGDLVFEDRKDRSMAASLHRSKESLNVEGNVWTSLVDELGLDKDAQLRLERVLRVLVSSELITDISEEDFSAFLRALAAALR
jgi:hypothetical protein